MTEQATGPSAVTRVLLAGAAIALVAASIVLSTTPAEAAGLEAFASCDELQAHLEGAARDLYGAGGGTGGDDSVGGAPASAVAASPEASGDDSSAAAGRPASGEAGDGTNTQVEGIDELDIVDVLGDGRTLVARDGRVVLVDAGGREILATLSVAGSPQITFDEERATLWAVSTDGVSTTLTRSVLDGATFAATSTWALEGRLVNLRRDGERVHLVAVDEDIRVLADDVPMADTPPGAPEGGSSLPFGGTSPVACDEVLHSPLPGGPATTLVASFTATGALAPMAATEIVGAGDNILVTDTALYVSTPSFDGNRLVTGIHRFDLGDLRLTGSGSVEGRLLNQFSLDEHDGHLRAAVTVDGGGFIGIPMPVEGDGGIGSVEPGVAVDDVAEDQGDDVAQDPVAPETTIAPEPPAPTETTAAPEAEAPLNEIVTFDLDGALDVVGRTPRFGHAGETLHGIRFAGDIAYAVTFLQTDPLYVVDLSQPSNPRVLGEIEIPGFSAYLHPITETQVIGFGPDGDGQVVARLFDTTDPAAPRLLETVAIAAESPIVYDHHALRTDGDRLVIAANEYVSERPDRCGPLEADQAQLDELYRQLEALYQTTKTQPPPPDAAAAIADLEARLGPLSECVYPNAFPQARIVTLTPAGGSLHVASIETDAGDAQRVLPLGDGYLVVGTEITNVGPSGGTRTVLG